MAVAMQSQKIGSRMLVSHYDFDPDATTATDIAWVDMRDFGRFLCSFFRTVGTSALTLTILANSESDGSGTDVELKSKTFTAGQPNALGDYVFLECTAQEMAAAGTDLRYITANCTVATGTDEGVVTYIRSDPRFAYEDLSADVIS